MNRMPALARVLLNFSKELLAIISLAYEQRRRKLGGGGVGIGFMGDEGGVCGI